MVGFGPVRLVAGLRRCCCCLAAYSVGLPEQPRTRRAPLVAALVATATAALAISVVQLFVGDALLPRFVVLGSAVVLVPWFVLCAALAGDVDVARERTGPGGRGRGSRRDGESLEATSRARRSGRR